MPLSKVTRSKLAALACAGVLLAATSAQAAAAAEPAAEPTVELSANQLKAIKIEPVGEHLFRKSRRPSAISISIRSF